MRRAQMLLASLGRLTQQPLTTLLIVAVVGVALALPLAFIVLVDNLDRAGTPADGQVQASLFLSDKVSDDRAERLGRRLQEQPEVVAVEVLSRAEALAEFRRMSDFSAALDLLDENPLPATIILTLDSNPADRTRLPELVDELRRLPEVDHAQLDEEWLQRLYAILAVVNRGAMVVALMLAIAVVIVIGTTIGLDIQNRRDEIAVTKLVGGTDAFIQRPFLYSGLWYGLGGGVLACVLVYVAVFSLLGPVRNLAGLYHSDFSLAGPGLINCLIALGVAALLGIAGSWIAVSRQLRHIEPT